MGMVYTKVVEGGPLAHIELAVVSPPRI